MNSRNLILAEFLNVPESTLVITRKLYREKFSKLMSEAAFMKTVSRLSKSGEIERISKGIYCKPKKTRFGTILPSEQEIAELFTKNNKGVVIGYGLYNHLGITTQVSKRITIYSSLADEKLKKIRNVTIYRYDLKYTSKTKAMIRMMELLCHYREIQDINHSAFLQNTEALSKYYSENVFESVQKEIRYPKRTVAFLKEILDHNHVTNGLSQYLSSLSDYKIPKMEEIYEAAQKPI